MKKINLRKFKFIFFIFSLTGGIALGFQNFTPKVELESLGEKTQSVTEFELVTALKTASQDHAANQVAWNIEPDHVQKSYRKDRKPQAITIENDNTTDDSSAPESIQNAKSFKENSSL